MTNPSQPFDKNRQFAKRDRLVALLAPILRAHGAELFDLELVGTVGAQTLRIFLEKEGATREKMSIQDGAVDVGTCARVSRELSPLLDVEEFVAGRYSLEVSSPGMERALRSFQDFDRFAGVRAKFRVREPVAGEKVFVATLVSADRAEGDAFRVTVSKGGREEKEYVIASADLQHVHLVFEFGNAPKPVATKGGPPKPWAGKPGAGKSAAKPGPKKGPTDSSTHHHQDNSETQQRVSSEKGR